LPHPDRRVTDPLEAYASLGRSVGQGLSVPCCLLFNESPHLGWVLAAIEQGFQLVMYTRDDWRPGEQAGQVRAVVEQTHRAGVAVEGEQAPLEGLAGGLSEAPDHPPLTDVEAARRFIAETGVDALAVNVGQVHLHGRRTVPLDLRRLGELRAAVPVPLVLHGASSLSQEDLQAAVRLGVRKVNVGSVLKQAYFDALCTSCQEQRGHANPYEVIGSGLERDVLVAGRLAMQRVVEEFMRVLGSAGRAGRKA
jgi:fructose/tagatose bisphosphate aldolase